MAQRAEGRDVQEHYMFQVQPLSADATVPSQSDPSFVELDDEQLRAVVGGSGPVGGWGCDELSIGPVGGW